MTLKEKRQAEQDELKAKRISHILESAFQLFAERGIEEIAMTDIAAKAEIGVASLYRYFQTKETLAIQCAEHTWLSLSRFFESIFLEAEYKNKSGIEQLEVILSCFTKTFEESSDFFRFIYYFDSFIHRSGVTSDKLDEYESDIASTKSIVMEAIKKGISDGSIKLDVAKDQSVDMVYYTMMHSMFAMSQKLALSGQMLNESKSFSGIEQLNLLSKMLIKSISC